MSTENKKETSIRGHLQTKTSDRFSVFTFVTAAMLMYRTIAKRVFWEFDSIIMQNISDILALFCTPTWQSHHMSENQELTSLACTFCFHDTDHVMPSDEFFIIYKHAAARAENGIPKRKRFPRVSPRFLRKETRVYKLWRSTNTREFKVNPIRVLYKLELIQNVRDVTYALSIQFVNFLSNYNSQARILKPAWLLSVAIAKSLSTGIWPLFQWYYATTTKLTFRFFEIFYLESLVRHRKILRLHLQWNKFVESNQSHAGCSIHLWFITWAKAEKQEEWILFEYEYYFDKVE